MKFSQKFKSGEYGQLVMANTSVSNKYSLIKFVL